MEEQVSKINPYLRKQKNLSLNDFLPKTKGGYCDCGCGEKLTGRQKRWASKNCIKPYLRKYYIISGDVQVIREELFKIDQGYCRNCGVYDENWQADHIKEVRHGGGGCGIEGFQTLCSYCHKEKTKNNYGRTS